MDGKTGPGENVSNTPHGMDELAKELDSMSVEDLKEEFKILVSTMDENSSCGDILELYLDAIARKGPQLQDLDARTSYEHFLKRIKTSDKKRRGSRVLLRRVWKRRQSYRFILHSVAVWNTNVECRISGLDSYEI